MDITLFVHFLHIELSIFETSTVSEASQEISPVLYCM